VLFTCHDRYEPEAKLLPCCSHIICLQRVSITVSMGSTSRSCPFELICPESYFQRVAWSLRISYATLTSENRFVASGTSRATSGCSFWASIRYACLIWNLLASDGRFSTSYGHLRHDFAWMRSGQKRCQKIDGARTCVRRSMAQEHGVTALRGCCL
jgi:hypothetical protein